MKGAICMIPARGGSKRIPRKNIRPFAGKHMIAWSIEAAQSARCFERIIVSTNDAEIAQIAQAHGAEVPFVRPAELSDDFATTQDVVVHALHALQTAGQQVQAICCLYATAPFVTGSDLVAGLEQLERADFAFPVGEFPAPLERALRISNDGMMHMAQPEHYRTRSQDLDSAYFDAGQFYWGKAQAWLSDRPLMDHKIAPIILPPDRIQDIDTEADWAMAEKLWHLL
jgi:pseudaminic acid cytidylyltransferase